MPQALPLIRPPRLGAGDLIGLINPSGSVYVRMPYKLRTHLVTTTLTQPRLVGWRRPLFWHHWIDVVDLEAPG